MIKITTNFDPKKIEQEIKKKALEAAKEQIKKDINKLARNLGENPRVTFKTQSGDKFTVSVENASEELDKKVQEYLSKK